MIKAPEMVAWLTVAGALAGGAIWAEDRYANASETQNLISTSKLILTNKQESASNTNRLERYVRELAAVHRRRQNGQRYPGDQALIDDINEEIRIAREYRSELKLQATQIK